MKKIDLTNQRFGNLIALKLDEERNKKSSQTFWICKCIKCNNTKSVAQGDLKKLKDNEWKGCCNNNKNGFIDLTNKTFGNLTVIKKDIEKSTKGRTFWLCDCKCGTKNFSIEAYSLKHRKLPNCGCMTKEIYSKTRFENNKNKYIDMGEYYIGYISDNDTFYFDKEDYDKVSCHIWYKDKGNYIRTRINDNNKKIALHNLVMDNYENNYYNRIDHINRDRTDCRKENLRICSHHENNMNKGLDKRNKSGVSGVFWSEECKGWIAHITKNYKQIQLGAYSNFEDAVKARLIKEKEIFGEFAPQQNLYKVYNIEDDGIMPKKKNHERLK